MRLLTPALWTASVCGQAGVPLPVVKAPTAPAVDGFRFVSDGPRAPGSSRPDEIPRKYFHEDLSALFERTISPDGDVPQRTTLRWIFTGPRAGLAVEMTLSKARMSERHYDSMSLYNGQVNYLEKATPDEDRQYTGWARTPTVIADAHLAVRVLVNRMPMLGAPLPFDVTRRQTRPDMIAQIFHPGDCKTNFGDKSYLSASSFRARPGASSGMRDQVLCAVPRRSHSTWLSTRTFHHETNRVQTAR